MLFQVCFVAFAWFILVLEELPPCFHLWEALTQLFSGTNSRMLLAWGAHH